MKLTEHFDSSEFRCKCGCGQGDWLMAPELVQALEELRELIGKPIIVNSAYRCPKHNAQVVGVDNSYHTQGMACDIAVSGMTAMKLAAFCEQIPALRDGGIGVYFAKHFVYVDVGPRRRWRE